jgi:hypothetical protein
MGAYEEGFKAILLKYQEFTGRTAIYEPFVFEPSKGDGYPPDFLVDTGGARVLFEFHNSCGQRYKLRLARTREIYGTDFYFILVQSTLRNKGKRHVTISPTVETPSGERVQYADEMWKMPKISQPGAKTSGVSHETWIKFVSRAFDGLIRRMAYMHGTHIPQELIKVRRAS